MDAHSYTLAPLFYSAFIETCLLETDANRDCILAFGNWIKIQVYSERIISWYARKFAFEIVEQISSIILFVSFESEWDRRGGSQIAELLIACAWSWLIYL